MGKKTGQTEGHARRTSAIVARVVTASLGGYALAVASAFLFARALPISRAEATTAASIIAILVMPVAAVWAVSASSAPRALGGLVAVVAALAGVAWALGPHA